MTEKEIVILASKEAVKSVELARKNERFNKAGLCKLLGTTRATIDKMILDGRLPMQTKLGDWTYGQLVKHGVM
jgi:predicted DNA-binding transcriptional regulator AlpA